MKNIIKLFVLASILIFGSCSNDDDNNANANNQGQLKIGDLTVELTQGYLESYGARGEAFNMDFTARSKTLFSSENEAVIYFELFSPIEGDLAKGNYEFGTYSEANAFTYTKWGQVLMGKGVSPFDTGVTVSDGVKIRPTSGTFTVHENGETYKISFTGAGDAEYYTDGTLTSSEKNVNFSVDYQGGVERYNNESMSAKTNKTTKGRPIKRHKVIF